jgi:hypothetical protein
MNCAKCGLSVGNKDKRITCAICKLLFHFPDCSTCDASFDRRHNWACNDCKESSDSSNSAENSAKLSIPTKEVSLEDVMKQLMTLTQGSNAQFAEIGARFDAIDKELSSLQTLATRLEEQEKRIHQIEQVQATLAERQVSYDTSVNLLQAEQTKMKNEILHLRTELGAVNKRCDTQEQEIIQLKQYSRKTSLVVSGVPGFYNENVRLIAMTMMKYLGIQNATLLDCHRLGRKATSNLLLKFGSYYDSQRFQQAAKVKRAEQMLKVSDIFDMKLVATPYNPEYTYRPKNSQTDGSSSVQEERRIKQLSVYQHLCPELSKLYEDVRRTADDANYEYCWHVNGHIYTRRDKGATREEFVNGRQVLEWRKRLGLPQLE